MPKMRCDQIKDREPFFAVRFLCWSSLKHNFTITLKKLTVFELLHLQNPCFNFFENVPKMPKDKNLFYKNEAKYENSTIKLQ